MPNLSIKGVPEDWAEALRQRAARNHRSLQGELMAIIETAATEKPDLAADSTHAGFPTSAHRPGAGTVVGLDARGRPIVRRGWKTIEQIAAEQRARGLPPMDSGPLGVDIIREDRDSR
jgi:plasmid stability protein